MKSPSVPTLNNRSEYEQGLREKYCKHIGYIRRLIVRCHVTHIKLSIPVNDNVNLFA